MKLMQETTNSYCVASIPTNNRKPQNFTRSANASDPPRLCFCCEAAGTFFVCIRFAKWSTPGRGAAADCCIEKPWFCMPKPEDCCCIPKPEGCCCIPNPEGCCCMPKP